MKNYGKNYYKKIMRIINYLMASGLIIGQCYAASITENNKDILLDCIGEIESGMNYNAIGDRGRAIGAWQMHKGAWKDANKWRKNKGLPKISRGIGIGAKDQRGIAMSYLNLLLDRFKANGIVRPNAVQVYVAWNWGFDNLKRVKFDVEKSPKSSIENAQFVSNLFEQRIKQ